MEILPLILAAPLLGYMAYSDLRYMRIPNWLSLGLLAVFVLCAPLLGWGSVSARLLAGAILFGLLFVAFCLRIFGGGDVKALSALILLVPPGTVPIFCLLFSASLLLAILGVSTARAMPAARGSRWVGLRAGGMLPMGVAIAGAGLALPVVLNLL